MKNKKVKVIVLILVLLIIMAILFFLVDLQQVKNNRDPIFCINTLTYRDGGSKEYLGLGYKIIKYHNNSGKDFEIGTYFLKYE